MIKYWYCVNIPPRSLVDFKKADATKRTCDQLEKFFFFFIFFIFFIYFFFFTDWFGSRTGSVRFGSDWFGSRTGSVRGLVRLADWFGSRTGTVRFGSRTGPVRFGADRKFFGFLFSRERRRDGDGEVERVGKTWKVWKTGVRFPGGGDGSG